MEKQLFDWGSVDELGCGAYQFYNCVMKVACGPYVPGDEVPAIVIDFPKATIEFHSRFGAPIGPFSLKLSIES